MTTITQPKRGEVARWMLWLMASAIAAMSVALIALYQRSEDRLKEKDAEIMDCQEKRNQAEAAFRAEISALYKEVQEFREEIYRTSMNQQRQLKRLKK